MNVVRRDKALEDLADCAFYIAEDDPGVADRFVDAFDIVRILHTARDIAAILEDDV